MHHLTGGSKKEGRIACEMMMALGNKQPVELQIEGGARVVVAADKAPIVDGVEEQRMRVGCGSATIGIFAQQWFGHVDEVVVVDDHITGVLSEHQAGKFLDMAPTGIRVRGRKSTPGRYFQVANPGHRLGRHRHHRSALDRRGVGRRSTARGRACACSWSRPPARTRPGSSSTTTLVPRPAEMPAAVRRVVDRIGENCEPSLCSVLYVAGAGGSLRAGVTENPVALTRSIKSLLVNVTCGGAPVYVWPGGGITVMVDVAKMPANSFGSVPTPAIVSPIEFTMRLDDYRALGGHMDRVRRLDDVLAAGGWRVVDAEPGVPWPLRAPGGGRR